MIALIHIIYISLLNNNLNISNNIDKNMRDLFYLKISTATPNDLVIGKDPNFRAVFKKHEP